MASLFDRLSAIIKPKESQVLDKDTDTGDALDHAYRQQLDLLQHVRRGAAEVASSRKELDQSLNQLAAEMDRLTTAARHALAQGRDDLAREALTRKAGLHAQLHELESDRSRLLTEEEKLVLTSTRLQAKADAFRTRIEALRATEAAEDARARIEEASAAVSRELGDVGEVIRDAETAALQTRQRASALGDLIANGTVPPITQADESVAGESSISPVAPGVEEELQALRADLADAAVPTDQQYQQPGSLPATDVQDAPITQPVLTQPAVTQPVLTQPPVASEPLATPPTSTDAADHAIAPEGTEQ
ncbi:hypothetical protein GCM10009785_18640 [Brooklawnia cerclae]|uniref:Phage shock protein A n=1 Tax=Brooklawnia cerclae TaxID=349934 RepID=A0ABX0SJS5_9ACTN|nr:PspA/IM30 family protein [Brooklawnia cerclae]NIH57563.1 phage shock protein A [Brooklawnia cerclae]